METALSEGARKAAILMVLLGEETSASILRHCEEPEIFAIGRAVASLGDIDPALAERILGEYRDRILAHREASEGGEGTARRILSRTLPPDRAGMIEESLLGSDRRRVPAQGVAEGAFSKLGGVGDLDLAQALELEHPQTAALVLLHLEPSRAAAVLASMNEEVQPNVTLRLARVSAVSPDVTREVSEALAARLEKLRPDGLEERDGLGTAAEILKSMERAKGRTLLGRLEEVDPECADTLRSRVYTFEMLLWLDDRGVQEILKGVEPKLLAVALKGATPEAADKFFRNMSTRAAEIVRDEMEYLGVAKVKDVEQAQKEILDRALKLEEEGTIAFEPPGEAGGGL